MRNIPILFILLLASCAAFGSKYPELPNRVQDLKAIVTVLETGALAYQSRPLCGRTRAKICSDINIVRNVEKGRAIVETTLRAAEKVENQSTIYALQESVNNFQIIVHTISPEKGVRR